MVPSKATIRSLRLQFVSLIYSIISWNKEWIANVLHVSAKEVNEPAFFSVCVRGPNYPFLFTRCYENTNNALVTAS